MDKTNKTAEKFQQAALFIRVRPAADQKQKFDKPDISPKYKSR